MSSCGCSLILSFAQVLVLMSDLCRGHLCVYRNPTVPPMWITIIYSFFSAGSRYLNLIRSNRSEPTEIGAYFCSKPRESKMPYMQWAADLIGEPLCNLV